jgi:hypothetical protein
MFSLSRVMRENVNVSVCDNIGNSPCVALTLIIRLYICLTGLGYHFYLIKYIGQFLPKIDCHPVFFTYVAVSKSAKFFG